MVADLGQALAHVGAIQDAMSDGLLQIVASSPERTTGSAISLDGDTFTVRSAVLWPEPERLELGITEGGVIDLADEIASIVHNPPCPAAASELPASVAPGRPLLAEDAVLLAETVVGGDPDKEQQVLDLVGLPATPRWLRDLAFGARLSLTACLLDIWHLEILTVAVVTGDGWGRLDLHDGHLRFTPLTTVDVQEQLRGACRQLVRHHDHTKAVC